MARVIIHAENTAQGTNATPNPLVHSILEKLTTGKKYGLKRRRIKLVDLGCGKLRHLQISMEFSNQIILVDTKMQIERMQKFAGVFCTMREYLTGLKKPEIKTTISDASNFAEQEHHADIILSVAVMDVVTKESRSQIARAAYRNTRCGGYFVVIVPRNDSSILAYCRKQNEFQDGYIIKKRGRNNLTFYANFRDPLPLLKTITNVGFELVEDLSEFRHIGMILQKPVRLYESK